MYMYIGRRLGHHARRRAPGARQGGSNDMYHNELL